MNALRCGVACLPRLTSRPCWPGPIDLARIGLELGAPGGGDRSYDRSARANPNRNEHRPNSELPNHHRPLCPSPPLHPPASWSIFSTMPGYPVPPAPPSPISLTTIPASAVPRTSSEPAYKELVSALLTNAAKLTKSLTTDKAVWMWGKTRTTKSQRPGLSTAPVEIRMASALHPPGAGPNDPKWFARVSTHMEASYDAFVDGLLKVSGSRHVSGDWLGRETGGWGGRAGGCMRQPPWRASQATLFLSVSVYSLLAARC